MHYFYNNIFLFVCLSAYLTLCELMLRCESVEREVFGSCMLWSWLLWNRAIITGIEEKTKHVFSWPFFFYLLFRAYAVHTPIISAHHFLGTTCKFLRGFQYLLFHTQKKISTWHESETDWNKENKTVFTPSHIRSKK
jgi:hypothetical protein